MTIVDIHQPEKDKLEGLKSLGIDDASKKAFQARIAKVSDEEKMDLWQALIGRLSDSLFHDEEDQKEVETLLLKGAAPSYYDAKLDTFPLLLCAENNYKNALCLLIKAGADVDQVNGLKKSALMKASEYGNVDIALYLIICGAKLNLRDLYGNNALMIAYQNNQSKIFEMLLYCGSVYNNVNIYGQTIFNMKPTFSFENMPLPLDRGTNEEEKDLLTYTDIQAKLTEAKQKAKEMKDKVLIK